MAPRAGFVGTDVMGGHHESGLWGTVSFNSTSSQQCPDSSLGSEVGGGDSDTVFWGGLGTTEAEQRGCTWATCVFFESMLS